MNRVIVTVLIVIFAVIGFFLSWNPALKSKNFIVSAWIPYWSKLEGTAAVKKNLIDFNELSPFAFEVSEDGVLLDTLKINQEPWPKMLQQAQSKRIAVIPTILWTDPKAMHNVLGDSVARKHHIIQIVNLIEKERFTGIDIDYEGKDLADKDLFSHFIVELSSALKPGGYSLSCTVEARRGDYPPSGWQGVRAMAWANDYRVLNAFCDSVRIMAYDQIFLAKGIKKEWTDDSEKLYAPNADIRWVEDVVKYAARNIDRKKIVLGIPTYGWKYLVKGSPGKWVFKCQNSISFPEAVRLSKVYSRVPKRDNTTELHFEYKESKERYMIWFPDGVSILKSIRLAKKYQLGGIAIFKIDGLEDDKIWQVLPKI